MKRTALKTFATNARVELLNKVESRALKIGITAELIKKADIESSAALIIDGQPLSVEEQDQRNTLINRMQQIGFDQVIDEVAYTWFNRFTALRYMEVNDYLPTRTRVLSSVIKDRTEPDMMQEALSLDLEIDKEYIYDLKMENKTDELFKYLIIKHCNDLNSYMPFMFEMINDYTELLFPEGLLATNSFVRHMTNTDILSEDHWKDVEVIGWLYQYYISDEKDRIFAAKKKYLAEEIPYATQLFTPNWIVQYMVQNSLGRYWLESHPEHQQMKDNWHFYLEDANQQEKNPLDTQTDLRLEDITCFDPAMGSGHILIYMFDILYEMYRKSGYTEREIPRLIIENNLYGLDIDDRTYQLASFSVVMKALEYHPRFLRSIKREGLTLHLASIQETNDWSEEEIAYIAGETSGANYDLTQAFIHQFQHAKTLGSLLKITCHPYVFLEKRMAEIKESPMTDLFEETMKERALSLLPSLITQAHIMKKQYDVLVTNPPYMGSRYMNKVLATFLHNHYPDSRRDLFAAFMEIDHYLKDDSFYASINQHSWMFLSSFEKLREKVVQHKQIDSMLHLGPRAFEEIGGEVVQSTTFVLRNRRIPSDKGVYLRLVDEGTAEEKKAKTIEGVQHPSVFYRYTFQQDGFNRIPGSPIAYWVTDTYLDIFRTHPPLGDFAEPRQGIATSKNDTYLRNWYEIDFNKMGLHFQSIEEAHQSNKRWFPYNKGGSYRRWYGNQEFVISFDKKSYDKLATIGNNLPSRQYYFQEGITYTFISTTAFAARFTPKGFLFDVAGSTIFAGKANVYYLLGFLTSKITASLLAIQNPTLNFQVGNIRSLPLKVDKGLENKIEHIVKDNIDISKRDWDSFETSWEFKRHPFLSAQQADSKLEVSFQKYEAKTQLDFEQLKRNEEALNRLFIGMYGLDEELSDVVHDEEVSIRPAHLERDIKSFLSYAIGCIFGRYSLDQEGLIFAGGEFDATQYETIPVDQNNILSILPGAYFEDDIVSRLIAFVKITYGEEDLEENLAFIASALKRRKNETSRETLRRYLLNDFFKDHVRMYKKRPIYWLFTSGKEKAFNCLIYMHRYDKTTLSRIRTDYLHDYQIRLDTRKKDLLSVIEGDVSTKEKNEAKRDLRMLDRQLEELKTYDEVLHYKADMQIELDMDDGVKVNYEKFSGLLAKM